MDNLYKKYRELRTEHPYPATTAVRIARARLADPERKVIRDAVLLLNGIDPVELERELGGGYWDGDVLELANGWSVTLENGEGISLREQDYEIHHANHLAREWHAGWGHDGRELGRFGCRANGQRLFVLLPGDCYPPEELAGQGSKQMRLEEGCRRQDDMRRYAEEVLDGDVYNVYVTITDADGVERDATTMEHDSTSQESVDYLVEETMCMLVACLKEYG